MTRFAIVLILVALASFLALSIPDETTEPAASVKATATTVLSDNAAPSLPDNFPTFIDGVRKAAQKPPVRPRVKPSRSGLFNAAYASEVAQIVREVFGRFGQVVVDQALRVAWCESRMVPTARLGVHIGIFQLSGTYHRERAARLGFAWSQMSDARPNATVAADLWSETHSWRAWSCKP